MTRYRFLQNLASVGVDVTFPIRNGIIQDWESMHRVWRNAWDHMTTSEAAGWLILDKAQPNSRDTAERQTAMVTAFETFDFPSFMAVKQTSAQIFAAGRTTALGIDIGVRGVFGAWISGPQAA